MLWQRRCKPTCGGCGCKSAPSTADLSKGLDPKFVISKRTESMTDGAGEWDGASGLSWRELSVCFSIWVCP